MGIMAEILSIIAAVAAILACVLAAVAVIRVGKATKDIQSENEKLSDKVHREIGESTDRLVRAQNDGTRSLREEMNTSITNYQTIVSNQVSGIAQLQQAHLEEFGKKINNLSEKNEARLEQMRQTVEVRIKELQNENNIRLDEMRQMVDEQLSTKLQKRLDDSFNVVSQRLEQVYKGLGEMQTLAAGVGDLKKVLTNVKTRGIWGEYQLGNLLEQMLAPGQYAENIPIPARGRERVEYAVKMPGKGDGEFVWMPIDSKFPQEDYLRLIDVAEQGDADAIKAMVKQLEISVKNCARQIRDKYIKPPYTTDFAIMYLPVEGLYAEVLRIPGLAEMLQREYKVVPSGPTTLTALLNSLQMGFKTLAIEKRSGEVWKLLGAFKTEFVRFSDTLQKTQKKLIEASNTMGDMEKRTSIIGKKLRDVQELEEHSAENLIQQSVEENEEII